jgi:hypothetical protein
LALVLFRLTLLIYLIFSSTIWGDIILLKSGKSIEGKFIESNEQYTVVDNFEKKIQIQNSQIESVEVGFSGIPVCYQLKDNPSKNCKALLHILSESKVVIVYGKGFLEIIEKEPQDFQLIQIFPNVKRDYLSKHIKAGIGINLKLENSNSLSGIFISKEVNDKLKMENQDGSIFFVLEKEIVEAEYNSSLNRNNLTKNGLIGFIPGLPQFLQGKTQKGAILMGFSLFTGVGAIYEYNNAKNTAQNSEIYLPIGNQLVVTNSLGSNSSFQRHKSNFQILTVGFVALYLYHFFDTYYMEDKTATLINVNSESNEFKSILFSYPERSGPYSFWSPSNIQYFEFTFKF